MKLAEAVKILQVLLVRDADCRDGNFDLSDEEREAIKTMIEATGADYE